MAAGKAGANDEFKIFIGGLHRDTNEVNLKDHFSKYGKVADSVVKRDPVTGNSRGFGFVQFEDMASIDLAMSEPKHILQGKQVDPKRAKAKSETMTRIFVGGLDPNMPEEEVREYFGQYGKIENIEMPFDKERNARRGFCFVTFESTDSVRSVTGMGKHTVGNRQVDVKVAQPKDMSFFRGGRGGAGGQRGSYNGRGGYGGGQGGYGGPPSAYGGPGGYGGPGSYSGSGGYGGPQGGYGPPQGAYGGQGGYGTGGYGAPDYGASYGGAPQGGYYPPANGVGGYNSYGGDSYQGYPPAQPTPAHNGAGYGRGKGADRYAPY